MSEVKENNVNLKETEEKNAILSNEEVGSNIRGESKEIGKAKGSKGKKQRLGKVSNSGGSSKVEEAVRKLPKDLKKEEIIRKVIKCSIRNGDGGAIEKEVIVDKLYYGDIVDIAPNLAMLIDNLSSIGITPETFGLSPGVSAIVLLNALPDLTPIIATSTHLTTEELRNMEIIGEHGILNLIATLWDINKDLIVELFSTFQISVAQKPGFTEEK